VNGVVSLPEGELLFTSQPILTSEGEGPINGVQFWGRYLNESFFEQLSATTNFTVTFQRVTDNDWPADFVQATQYLSDENLIFVEPLDNVDIVAGYTVLNDIYGQPAMMLRVDTPRAIYTQGQSSINYFILAMVLISIILAGVAQSRVTLQQENTELEQRVEERTAELSRINTQLRQEITERKRAEENLEKARDDAVEALQLKSKIMANVSHEGRTPLTTIVLRTELLQRGRYGHISNEQRRILDLVLMNARQMLAFFNNLLTESQLNSDKIILFKAAFSPTTLLDDVVEMMNPRAEQKGLQLRREVGERVPNTLIGDPDQLMLIITNLLDNAIKFTEHGKLTVIIDCPDESHWILRVIDTGRGIPTSAQQRIFEPFWQIDGSMTREISRGVGLGLSIVQQLTALMDGEISVSSEVGQGTTFTITFPMTEAQGET
jgi:signal transduction histidine kinase